MNTFRSIRIYYSGNFIEPGFYDVIGYFGPEISPTSGYYIIDIN
jgi:hypothetical protein